MLDATDGEYRTNQPKIKDQSPENAYAVRNNPILYSKVELSQVDLSSYIKLVKKSLKREKINIKEILL
jgi:hypothetical protein